MQLGKGTLRIKESSYPSRHPPTGYRHHWRDPTELQSQHPRSSLSPPSPASRSLSLAFRSALTALQPLRPPLSLHRAHAADTGSTHNLPPCTMHNTANRSSLSPTSLGPIPMPTSARLTPPPILSARQLRHRDLLHPRARPFNELRSREVRPETHTLALPTLRAYCEVPPAWRSLSSPLGESAQLRQVIVP